MTPKSRGVFIRMAFVSSGEREGFRLRIRAASPATCGVAMLVPLIVLNPLSAHAEVILSPGADTSGFILLSPVGPRLLKPLIRSFTVTSLPVCVEPTVNLMGYAGAADRIRFP